MLKKMQVLESQFVRAPGGARKMVPQGLYFIYKGRHQIHILVVSRVQTWDLRHALLEVGILMP